MRYVKATTYQCDAHHELGHWMEVIPQMTNQQETRNNRDTFNTRLVFLMAAIGSAVGLGNIWRFPYVAYDNGGGAFLIPYLVALLTAGIPLLWFDLAFGHRFRGSAPLAFRRASKSVEAIGWFKVGVNFFIGIYYAAIIGWAGLYTLKSFTKAWGNDTTTYFVESFLKLEGDKTFSGNFVISILIAMIFVWIVAIATLALNINAGIGRLTTVFLPVLVVLFLVLVVRALFLDGAVDGLNAFFTPDWSVLSDPSVWIAAYGQIFFSLSIGFGIMITYASYLKPRTSLTNTGLVTAFANSSFEVLAGIGVFAVLGYMAMQSGVAVDEVVSGGIGLAFMAFPEIINQMPFGEVFGVIFFGCLFLAGITSLISILEVVFAGIADKFNASRAKVAVIVGSFMAVISCLLFSATSGLIALDTMDKFTNNLGIVFGAIISVFFIGWVLGRRNEMAQHINAVSGIRVGGLWQLCAFALTPAVLTFMLITEIISLIKEPYEGYTQSQIFAYGWLSMILIILCAIIMPLIAFRGNQVIDGLASSDYGVPVGGRAKGQPNPLGNGTAS